MPHTESTESTAEQPLRCRFGPAQAMENPTSPEGSGGEPKRAGEGAEPRSLWSDPQSAIGTAKIGRLTPDPAATTMIGASARTMPDAGAAGVVPLHCRSASARTGAATVL